MTEFLDLSFIKNKQQTKKQKQQEDQKYDFEKLDQKLINRTLEKMIYQIDKNFIKNHQSYFFHLDYAKIKGEQYYWNNRFRIYCLISVKQKIFTLKLYLLDLCGNKICSKSTHHRTLLSNFVLQINAQLQNFKLQYNPQSGQFSFVFNINCQYIDQTSVTDLIQYALECYFEESQAHFFILSLIEIVNFPHNQFLLNIDEDSQFLKRYFKERRNEAIKLKKQLQLVKQDFQLIEKTLKQQTKSISMTIRDIKNYLLYESNHFQVQKEPNPNTLKQAYRKFKEYYKEQSIFSRNLANKAKYKNYIQIQAKGTTSFSNLFSQKSVSNFKQGQSFYPYQQKFNSKNTQLEQKNDNQAQKNYHKLIEQISQQTQRFRIWDKNSGKNYLIQLIHMRNGTAKKQEIILQKMCKIESFLFFNQYFFIENFELSKISYIAVNANPNRILLLQFLKNNNQTISLAVRFTLCINLLEIFYTLIVKSKITNYFPQISTKNLEISRNLCLSFKHLSNISVYPLLELINTISQIIFQNPISSILQSKRRDFNLVKGDEVDNKFWGVSTHINMIKFYLLEIYQESIYLMKLQDFKANKTNRSQQTQKIDYQIKQTLLRSCQQLLVLFKHFKNSLSRGYEEQFNFNQQFSDED